MATIYVVRSPGLSTWAADVGLSKHLYKLGVAERPVKELVAAGWAGLTDWVLVKQQELAGGADEVGMIERLSPKARLIDPRLYPRLKGTLGVFKVLPAQVENHILVTRALAGTEQSGELKLKPADFAGYLLHHARRPDAA